MSGQWKPGDVGLVTCSDGKERIAICGERWLDDFLVWVFRDKTLRDVAASDARPLVVIDPEDAEQVRRLAVAYDTVFERMFPEDYADAANITDNSDNEWMQAALREFAAPTPPRPDEPTGKYAAVVDRAGMEWLRDGLEEESGGPWWSVDRAQQSSPGPQRAVWSDIAAVRVLTEGVTA